jgi:NAD(P)-dependent dehydrogenase (short-subunit alcohol dehydrogenase family)
MTARLAGRRTLVTGGASGLGAGIVQSFAAEGSAIAIADLPSAGERAQALVAEIQAQGVRACRRPRRRRRERCGRSRCR